MLTITTAEIILWVICIVVIIINVLVLKFMDHFKNYETATNIAIITMVVVLLADIWYFCSR